MTTLILVNDALTAISTQETFPLFWGGILSLVKYVYATKCKENSLRASTVKVLTLYMRVLLCEKVLIVCKGLSDVERRVLYVESHQIRSFFCGESDHRRSYDT